jgi:hypothetical protein
MELGKANWHLLYGHAADGRLVIPFSSNFFDSPSGAYF